MRPATLSASIGDTTGIVSPDDNNDYLIINDGAVIVEADNQLELVSAGSWLSEAGEGVEAEGTFDLESGTASFTYDGVSYTFAEHVMNPAPMVP